MNINQSQMPEASQAQAHWEGRMILMTWQEYAHLGGSKHFSKESVKSILFTWKGNTIG